MNVADARSALSHCTLLLAIVLIAIVGGCGLGANREGGSNPRPVRLQSDLYPVSVESWRVVPNHRSVEPSYIESPEVEAVRLQIEDSLNQSENDPRFPVEFLQVGTYFDEQQKSVWIFGALINATGRPLGEAIATIDLEFNVDGVIRTVTRRIGFGGYGDLLLRHGEALVGHLEIDAEEIGISGSDQFSVMVRTSNDVWVVWYE